MITPPSLAELKAFACISTTDDDFVLTTMLDAAAAFVEQATGQGLSANPPTFPLDIERGKLAVMMLAAHWYENREPVTDGEGATRKVPLHLRSLIAQLRGGVLEPGVPAPPEA